MLTTKTILLVDDDADLRDALAEELEVDAGYRVRHAGTVAEARALIMARDSRIDAVILDVGLPDGSGRDLVATLRRNGIKIPIIMLSGASGEHEVIAGLDAGANDFMLKPFRCSELLARLRAQFRTFEVSEDVAFRIGPYVFRPAAKLLQDPLRKTPIRLTEKEAAVLKYLYRAEGTPVGRHTLLLEVWGYNPEADSHTVETHIYRLRRKIEPNPGEIRILLNVGGGYRLCGEEWNVGIQAPPPVERERQIMSRAA